jgi:dolichyl-diphosphooligosaccharide--protein glycosyltransferase
MGSATSSTEGEPAAPRARAAERAALAAIAVVGALIRLAPLRSVFTPWGIRLIPDGDPYYHLIRAGRIVAGHLEWFDRGLNHPVGAEILWPPGFDALLAAASWLAAPWVGDAGRRLELAAAALPVLLGVATIVAVAWLAREVLGRGALAAALVAAVFPPSLLFSHVGRADHHALEPLLLAGILAPFVRACRAEDPRRQARAAALAGALLCLAFWSWPGSALHLVLLVGAGAVAHVAGPDDRSRERFATALAWTCASAAGLLVLSLALLGGPGALRSGRITGISGLPAALCALSSAAAALLAWRARRPAHRATRVLEVATAGSVAVGALLAVPALRGGILHGLRALVRGNPWYEWIAEFYPILFSGRYPLGDELRAILMHHGLLLPAAAAAIPLLAARWREEPDRRPAILVACALSALIIPLSFARARMNVYLVLPLAVLAPEGIRWLAARLAPARLRAIAGVALGIAVLAPCAPVVARLRDVPAVQDTEATIRISERLRESVARLPPGAADGWGVLAPWERGHHVRYYSGLPVLTTPFGTDTGEEGMEDSARFHLAETEPEAEAVLARRQLRWVLVQAIDSEAALGAYILRAPGITEVRSVQGTTVVALSPRALGRIGPRLFYRYGVAEPGVPALAAFRLVDEQQFAPWSTPARLFEHVPGARLEVEGAAPSSEVVALTEVTAPTGRVWQWSTRARTDGQGRATLRVPYATGENGRAHASACYLMDGKRTARVAIPEAAIVEGAVVPAALR